MEFAFPNHQDAPTVAAQGFSVALVSRLVRFEFGKPIIESRLRHPATVFMPMPEATMHKDNSMATWENEIRIAGEIAPVQSEAETKRVNKPSNNKLWLGIF